MNDSKDFKDAESVRSGHSNVTSQPESLPPHPVPGGMLSRSRMPSRIDGLPSIWDTHGISGNVFANPVASTLSAGIEPTEFRSRFTHPVEKSEKQTQDQDQRCQSGQSAQKILASSVEETLQRIMKQTNKESKFRLFILTNSPRQQHSFVGR